MDDKDKVSDYWGAFHNKSDRPKLSWLESDVIVQYVSKRVTGDLNKSFYEIIKKYKSTKFNRALIVGCGSGQLERDLIKGNFIECAVGVDISKESIELAKYNSKLESISDKLEYRVFDLECGDYKKLGHYDIIIVCMVAHHVENLRNFFYKLKELLIPNGIIVLNEYIGPNRFWHNDKTVNIINKLLAVIDESFKYNHLISNGELREEYVRTPLSHFMANDPSEAINSEKILKNLSNNFSILENKSYGGQINHMLLSGIIDNFSCSASDKTILRLLMAFEEILEDSKVIKSDFAFIVAKPKNRNWFETLLNKIR